jgi:hypothetical protein
MIRAREEETARTAHVRRDPAGAGNLRPAQRAAPALGRTEERRERAWERHVGQSAERGALRALTPCEGGAVLALPHVGAQGAALGAPEHTVQVTRDRALGLVAGEGALELHA